MKIQKDSASDDGYDKCFQPQIVNDFSDADDLGLKL